MTLKRLSPVVIRVQSCCIEWVSKDAD